MKNKCNSETERESLETKIKDLENEITEMSADFNAKKLKNTLKNCQIVKEGLVNLACGKLKKW